MCERATAGGPRRVSSVEETDDAVSVLVLVEETAGLATCPMNPSFPITVSLQRPVGTRRLLDASTLPGRPITVDDAADAVVPIPTTSAP
jgi:hypothetical protein